MRYACIRSRTARTMIASTPRAAKDSHDRAKTRCRTSSLKREGWLRVRPAAVPGAFWFYAARHEDPGGVSERRGYSPVGITERHFKQLGQRESAAAAAATLRRRDRMVRRCGLWLATLIGLASTWYSRSTLCVSILPLLDRDD